MNRPPGTVRSNPLTRQTDYVNLILNELMKEGQTDVIRKLLQIRQGD